MSNKIKETKTATNATLKQLMTKYPNVSLRKLSQTSEISYPAILKAARKPVEGKKYDPAAVNYDAVSVVFSKRDIDINKLDWPTMNQVETRATLRKDINEFKIGAEVYLRKNNDTPYVIVYKTNTHIVLQLKGTDQVIAWNHNTFFLNGPSFEKRVVQTTEAVAGKPKTSKQKKIEMESKGFFLPREGK